MPAGATVCAFGGVRAVYRSMPTPAVALKLKQFRRRFGITAPRLVVRSHVPWQWYVLPLVLAFLLLWVAASLIFQRSEAGVVGRELEEMRERLQVQQSELDFLRSTAGTGLNAVSMERAAQQRLLLKVQALERENASLREDLLLYERLVSAPGEDGGPAIDKLTVQQEVPSRFRYRLALTFLPTRQTPEFRGRLQLLVAYQHAGREASLLLPPSNSVQSDYQLEIKRLVRREGVFELPAGAVLKSLEARVLQGDAVRARLSTQL